MSILQVSIPMRDLSQQQKNEAEQLFSRAAVIRSICKVLGRNDSVKEAYITHNFSIVESEITKVLSQSGKTFDWEQARKDMAEIQRCYTDKNPNTRRQSASRAQALSQKLVGMLEA